MAASPRAAGSSRRKALPRIPTEPYTPLPADPPTSSTSSRGEQSRPGGTPSVDPPATPGIFKSALGSTLSGVAIAVLLVIPALMELKAAHWNSSYTYALAQLVPPTTLGVGALAPLLPGFALGAILGFVPAQLLRRYDERTQAAKYQVAYRLRRRPDSAVTTWEPTRPPGYLWRVALYVLTLALIVGILGLLGWFTDNGSAPSLAISALPSTFATFVVVGMPQLLQQRRPYTFVTSLSIALVALTALMTLWLVTIAANPFPFATFQPASTNHTVTGQLVRTTDTGVWLLTDHGQPKFYTGPLDTLTICGREIDSNTHDACQP